TGYMMGNIVVIPMTGWLQRRIGFRRYFSVSVLIFTAASALCGLAWSLPALVMIRVLQGMGGGAIIPTSQAILFSRYPRAQVGMASRQYALEEGNREGWTDSTLILGLGALAPISLVTFIVHELEVPNPVVDLRVFKNRSYAAGTGLNFLLGLAAFGASYLFSL